MWVYFQLQSLWLDFGRGDSVAIDGKKMSPATLLTKLNGLGKANAIGPLDLVDNRFVSMKSKPDETRRPLKRVTFAVSRRGELKFGEIGLARGLAIAHGIDLAKNLGNTPSNICTPNTWPAKQRKSRKRTASAAKSSIRPPAKNSAWAPSCQSERAATSRRASSC